MNEREVRKRFRLAAMPPDQESTKIRDKDKRDIDRSHPPM